MIADPVDYVVTAASTLAGRPVISTGPVPVDVERAECLAELYLAAPATDPAALPSYVALRREIWEQLHYLTDVLGLAFSVSETDPYITADGSAPSSLKMRRDVRENRRITVLSTAVTGGHPFLTDADNDALRAVHDVFGHCVAGSDFSPEGEEAAFLAHRHLFSEQALPALACETRAQNAANTYGGLPAGDYADQKLVALPAWAYAR